MSSTATDQPIRFGEFCGEWLAMTQRPHRQCVTLATFGVSAALGGGNIRRQRTVPRGQRGESSIIRAARAVQVKGPRDGARPVARALRAMTNGGSGGDENSNRSIRAPPAAPEPAPTSYCRPIRLRIGRRLGGPSFARHAVATSGGTGVGVVI